MSGPRAAHLLSNPGTPDPDPGPRTRTRHPGPRTRHPGPRTRTRHPGSVLGDIYHAILRNVYTRTMWLIKIYR